MSYHDDFSTVSNTMLKLFAASPTEFHLTYNLRQMEPRAPRKPALAGQVLHAVTLERKAFEELVAIYPEDCLKSNGHINPTPARVFEHANDGMIFLKEAEAEGLLEVVRGVMAHPLLGEILNSGGTFEQPVYAEVDGVPCRAKPDILCDMGDHFLIYDFKFMENVDPGSWRRSFKRFRYWGQDAHYSRVVTARFGKPVVFRFFAVEVKFPYRVVPYWLGKFSRENAFAAHKKILADLKECRLTGDWSDRWKNEIDLSPWDLDTEESPDEVEISE